MAAWGGVELKLSRAVRHLEELTAGITTFLDGCPYAVHVQPEGDDLVYRVEVRDSPPLSLAGAAGDCIHNARSALDHLAWRLVEDGGGAPDRQTCFPISETEAKFLKALPHALDGASAGAIAAVEAVRPYAGGDNDLWAIHVLDNTDKHRLLLVVAAAWAAIETASPGLIAARMSPAEPIFPVADGCVLFRITGAVGRPLPQEVFPRPLFDLALRTGGPCDGEPVMLLLTRLITRVAEVAETLSGRPMPKP